MLREPRNYTAQNPISGKMMRLVMPITLAISENCNAQFMGIVNPPIEFQGFMFVHIFHIGNTPCRYHLKAPADDESEDHAEG